MDFIETPDKELPEDIVSDTRHTIHGYQLRCVKRIVKTKRTRKLKEKWFIIQNRTYAKLPEYIRAGAKKTGYNSLSSLFSALAFYNSTMTQ